MKKVLLRAPLLTSSGYGVHSRQVLRWLLSVQDSKRFGEMQITTHPLKWGNTSWMLNETMENGLIGRALSLANDDRKKHDVSFQIQLPNEWDTSLAHVNIGLTAAVESDRCIPEWVYAVNRMDAVVVPSEHIAQVLRNSGTITSRLTVIPEAFPDEIFSEKKDLTDQFNFDTSFNFLLVGQFTGNNPYNDRKNLFFTIKWLCEAFADDKDVGIVLKLNSGRASKIDREITMAVVSRLVNEVRKSAFPKIHVVHGALTNDEIVSLYKHPSMKALVSLTRGEGFGLPTLEAAACGLPVIATNWSGHLDFMNMGKFIKIDYDLKPIHKSRVDGQIFVEGSRWAEPSEIDFKRKAIKFRTKNDVVFEWAQDLAKKIKESHSQVAINKHYNSAFGSLL